MTDTWAAKVLAGVPRYFNSGEEYVHIDRALAAIAKLAEGDGLVERLAVKGPLPQEMPNHYIRRMQIERIEAAAHIAALTAQVAENRISEPHDPGDFVGDIYFGHPVKTTMGTHRWTGSEWVKLPSETEALMGLLADARSERDALRDRLARMEGEIAAEARRYAEFYPQGSDGQNTFVMFAEWVETRDALTDGGTE